MSAATDKLRQQLPRLLKDGTERTLYKPLCNWLEELAVEEPLKLRGVEASAEESAQDSEVGFPDMTVRHGGEIMGWFEVKLPDKPLSHQSYKKQFGRYQESLENLIITNLREWELWQWDREHDQKPKRMKTVLFDLQEESDPAELLNLLAIYFEYTPVLARTPKQLALALARKARFLSKQVEEALSAAVQSKDKDNELIRLRTTFEKTLIADIADHQFSNMVAETIAYSLFLAYLEHDERGNDESLTLTTAIDYLPKNVPILSDLFGLIARIAKKVPNAHHAATALLEQLNRADIHRIRQKLVEHKPGEDPVLQFYEPFLEAYDAKEKVSRGVFYTPKPVVDYIIRSIDELLTSKFSNCPEGLASKDVLLLDPAAGSGTFLMSAIQQVNAKVSVKNAALGTDVLMQEFRKVTKQHILPNFYGFELMVAPYAISHLKLTLEAERLGYVFDQDTEEGNERFKVYLANTLDDPHQKATQGKASDDFGSLAFPAIAEESEKARAVKEKEPILVITGNPPYSNFGQMNNGKWIMNLIEDYKKGVNETKFNWDDYVKFIRFAQWKLEQTGQGLFAMITNHTFLDAITLRGMRGSLLKSFDEIYIYNLHGNLLRGEVHPDGMEKDENVFPIRIGVSINFFVKHPEPSGKPRVFYQDLWGTKKHKYGVLLDNTIASTQWEEVDIENVNKRFMQTRWGKSVGSLNSFVSTPALNDLFEYGNYWSVAEIFENYGSGIQTKRDHLTIQYSEDDLNKIRTDFTSLPAKEIRMKYDLPEDGRDWKIELAQKDLQQNNPIVTSITYRLFDKRKTFFSGKTKGFLAYPRRETMQHMLQKNVGLIFKRQAKESEIEYTHALVSADPISEGVFVIDPKGREFIAPLYLYSKNTQQTSVFEGQAKLEIEGEQMELHGESEKILRKPNFNAEFISSVISGVGNGRFDPTEVFFYIYAILHSPSYRKRFNDLLKIDFPRIPVTTQSKLFKALGVLGRSLVNLHLLGENPLDNEPSIFEESDQWNIQTGKVVGAKIDDWKVQKMNAQERYNKEQQRVFVNESQYFDGIESEVWDFFIGGYQVLDKWLSERAKAGRSIKDELKHFMKIAVALRETIRLMKEIDTAIETHGGWPIK